MIESRDWTAYNAASCEEKRRFVALLSDLCQTVEQPEQTRSRPRLALSDMVFASVYKVYVGFSARRFTTDLQEAETGGYVGKAAHFNSVNRYLASRDLTGILKDLVAVSSLPLKAVETDFAVDSSGFSTSTYARWQDAKYGGAKSRREYFKAHLIVGVETNIVTGVDISGRTVNDTYFLKPLVRATAENFTIREVSADKAYHGWPNLEAVDRLGGTLFTPFRSNTVESKGDSVWSRMYHYFMFNREEFMARYHKRSNVETAFSMIKGKFGSHVKAKSDEGQVNEVLAKVLCHNICVVGRAIDELGIEPLFGSDDPFGSGS